MLAVDAAPSPRPRRARQPLLHARQPHPRSRPDVRARVTLFVAIDVTLATRSTRDLRDRFWRYPDGDPNALRVEVTARQWSWTFRTAGTGWPVCDRGRRPHPQRAARSRRAPGLPEAALARRDPLLLPAEFPDQARRHSWKHDPLWFQARETGRFEIGCAQHCGVSHYKMRAELAVDSPSRLRAWLARAETDSRLRSTPPHDLAPPTAGIGRPGDDGPPRRTRRLAPRGRPPRRRDPPAVRRASGGATSSRPTTS